MIDFERLADERKKISFTYGDKTVTAFAYDYTDPYDDPDGQAVLLTKQNLNEFGGEGFLILYMENIRILN